MQITDPLPWGFTVQNPLPPIDSQDGLFHDGNPVTGELGTILTSTWLNNVQGAIHSNQTELVSVLSAAGIAPDAARPDQLLAALQALYLGKAAQAADSAKLEGHPASYFAKADDLAKAGSDPLLWPRTSPSRTHIQAGYAPLDGQELSRALYPDAWSAIQSGAVPVVTESEWQADPLKRGAWTYGNGSTTFRMPDYNGKSPGSKGAVFVRGDGALSAGTPGLMQPDELKSHTHPLHGSLAVYSPSGGQFALNGGVGAVDDTRFIGAVGGAETRSLNVTSVWVCRLFGAVTNPGAADAAQLATEVARLWAQKLDSNAALGLGYSQTVTDVTASRSLGATYYNTTGRPIFVYVTVTSTSSIDTYCQPALTVNGVVVALNTATSRGSTLNVTVSAVVPSGGSYSASITYGSGTFTKWIELR